MRTFISRFGIQGKLSDKDGRCIHYNSELDIIANRCGKCRKFYACFKCHDELENHAFLPVSEKEKESVICGICGERFSYEEYSRLKICPRCKSRFNPRCALHKNIYSC